MEPTMAKPLKITKTRREILTRLANGKVVCDASGRDHMGGLIYGDGQPARRVNGPTISKLWAEGLIELDHEHISYWKISEAGRAAVADARGPRCRPGRRRTR